MRTIDTQCALQLASLATAWERYVSHFSDRGEAWEAYQAGCVPAGAAAAAIAVMDAETSAYASLTEVTP